MGLQNKIFIYAGISLVALMSLLTWISLQTNSQATDMVHQERLALVQSIALGVDDIIERLSAQTAGTRLDILPGDSRLVSFLQHQGGDYNLEVVDNSGLVLASSTPGSAAQYSSNWESISLLAQKRQAGIVTQQESGKGGHLIAFAPLTQLPWGLVLERPGE